MKGAPFVSYPLFHSNRPFFATALSPLTFQETSFKFDILILCEPSLEGASQGE